MARDALAEVYARALLEAAVAADAVAAVREAAETILEVWRAEPGIALVLNHPGISLGKKQDLVATSFAGIEQALAKNLLGVLVAKGRTAKLAAVLQAFGEACDERESVARGEVVTATPLANNERDALIETLVACFGRNVVLEEKVDPAVLGGFRARVGDLVFDTTVAAQRDTLAARLKKLPLPAGAWQEE